MSTRPYAPLPIRRYFSAYAASAAARFFGLCVLSGMLCGVWLSPKLAFAQTQSQLVFDEPPDQVPGGENPPPVEIDAGSGTTVEDKVPPDRNDVAKPPINLKADDGSGTFEYVVPVTLPPGVNGLAPEVSLEYSSAGALDSLVGAGFRLSVDDCIVRRGPAVQTELTGKTFPKGLPSFSDNDTFMLHGQRLTACDSQPGGATASCPSGTYRAIRNDFSKIEKRSTENRFILSKKDGTVVEYGHSKLAVNPFSNQSYPNDFHHQVRFCISKVTKNGNSIDYSYRDASSAPELELDSIDYGGPGGSNHTWRVKFLYENRPTWDVRQRFSSGGKELLHNRLKSIEVVTLPNLNRLRQVNLTYLPKSPEFFWVDRSFIQKVQECGTTDAACLQPYNFTYEYSEAQGWSGDGWHASAHGLTTANTLVEFGMYPVPLSNPPAYTEHQVTDGTSIVDLNHDGYPDLVRYDSQVGPKVFLNSKTGSWSEDPLWSGKFASIPPFFVGSAPYRADNGVRFMDLNGDGYQDIVYAVSQNGIVSTEVWLWNPALNAGTGGFDNSIGRGFKTSLANNQVLLAKFNSAGGPNLKQTPTGVFPMDLNGDGLVDFLIMDSSSQRKLVLLNTGSSFAPAVNWAFPIDPQAGCLGDSQVWPYVETSFASIQPPVSINMGLQFGDINGDGLTDIVQLFHVSDNVQICSGVSRYRYGVWLNTGNGWNRDDAASNALISQGFLSNELVVDWHTSVPAPSGEDVVVNAHQGLQLVDLDGDGAEDFFQRRCTEITTGGAIDCSMTGSYLSKPNGASTGFTRNLDWEWGVEAIPYFITTYMRPIDQIGGGTQARTSIDQDGSIRFIDLNKDGLPDLFGNRIRRDGQQEGLVELNNSSIARGLLKYVQNPLGGEVQVAYMLADGTPGTQSSSPELTSPKVVVRSISETNGPGWVRRDSGGSARTRIFDYNGGRYDNVERAFAGFSSVSVSDDSGAGSTQHSTTNYRNGFNDRCMYNQPVSRDSCYSVDGDVCQRYESAVTSYPACTGDVNGPFLSQPQTTALYKFDEINSSLFMSSKKSYEYDPFGNITAVYDYQSANDSDPYRVHWFVYGWPSLGGPWISDAVCQEGLMANPNGNSQPYWAKRYAYDGAMNFDPACSAITKGLVTRIEHRDSLGMTQGAGSPARIEEFTYTAAGNIASHKDARGFVAATNWNSTFPEIAAASSTNALGHVTSYNYDQYANLQTTVDPNGLRHELRYDAAQRLTQTWDEKAGQKANETQISYFPPSNIPSDGTNVEITTTTALSQTRSIAKSYVLDGLGRKILEKNIAGQSCLSVASEFDGAGRRTRKSEPYSSCIYDSFSTPMTRYLYDSVGRLMQTTLPGGYVFYTNYQIAHRGAVVALHEINYGSAMVPQFKVFDSENRLSAVAECVGTGCYNCVGLSCDDIIADTPGASLTTYKYDTAEDLIEVDLPSQASGRIRNFYDGFGQLLATKDPNISNCADAAIDEPSLGCPQTSIYDAAGNRTGEYDPQYSINPSLGNYKISTYDALGRITNKTIYHGASRTYYTYGYDAQQCSSGTSAKGLITSRTYANPATGEQFSESFCYDNFGRLASREISSTIPGASTGPADQIFGYSYFGNGILQSQTLPDNETLTFDYDDYGRPKSLFSSVAGTLVSNFTYSAEGRKSQISLGNGLTTDFGYRTSLPMTPAGDRRLGLLRVSGIPNHSAMSLSLDYDPRGNILFIGNNLGGGATESFGYDDLARLASFANGTAAESFSYDETGNRTMRQSSGLNASQAAPVNLKTGRAGRVSAASSQLSYDGSQAQGSSILQLDQTTGQISQYYKYGSAYSGTAGPNSLLCVGSNSANPCQSPSKTFAYDGNGNTRQAVDFSSGTTTSYSYDEESRLTRVQMSGSSAPLVRYFYGADGARVADIDAGTTTFYLDPSYEIKNSFPVRHYFLGGQQIAIREGTAPTKYFFTDHLGSIRAEFSASGNYLGSKDYLPFGSLLSTNGTIGSERGYNGNTLDAVGIYEFGPRHYHADLGRFLQPDPVIPDISTPQSFNRYSYVLNNPLRFTDPTGHEPADTEEEGKQKADAPKNTAKSESHQSQRPEAGKSDNSTHAEVTKYIEQKASEAQNPQKTDTLNLGQAVKAETNAKDFNTGRLTFTTADGKVYTVDIPSGNSLYRNPLQASEKIAEDKLEGLVSHIPAIGGAAGLVNDAMSMGKNTGIGVIFDMSNRAKLGSNPALPDALSYADRRPPR